MMKQVRYQLNIDYLFDKISISLILDRACYNVESSRLFKSHDKVFRSTFTVSFSSSWLINSKLLSQSERRDETGRGQKNS